MSKSPGSPTGYAPDWTEVQREAYKRAYREDRPIMWPTHDLDDPCPHCELLRELQREVDAEDDGE